MKAKTKRGSSTSNAQHPTPNAQRGTGWKNRIVGHGEVAPGKLAAHPENYKAHPERQAAALGAALDEIGYLRSVTVNRRTGTIVDGHLRVAVALKRGERTIPVEYVDLSPAEERAALAALDALIGSIAGGAPALAEALAELRVNTGDDLEADAEPQVDRADELNRKWKVKRGDLWLVGEHRLVCGDAGDQVTVDAAMGKAKADMVFMDPPYGHNNNDGDLIHNREAALGKRKTASSVARPIANDGPEANDLVRSAFASAKRLLKPGCCCCCCCGGGGGPDPQFARWALWLDEVMPFKMCVVWDKGGLGMGWHYRRNWECVLVAQQPGAACRWFGGNDVPNVIRDIGKIIPSKEDHPTPKPPELAAWFMRLHSAKGDVVVDSFSGCGSTMVAAENLGRRCFGIEIIPDYCAVILQRMADAFPGIKIRRG